MDHDNPDTAGGDSRYRAMFNCWLDRRREILIDEKARRDEAKEAWWVPKRRATSERRRIRDRDAKRAKRGKSAATTRQYTDCSNMTAEEKLDHRRSVEREKKRRQRQKVRAGAPYANNPAYGQF